MKTRLITSGIGLIVLALVLFTFDTMIFNIIIACIALAATHEIYMALGFKKKDLAMYFVQVPYVLLIMNSDNAYFRSIVLIATFVLMLFYCMYLVFAGGRVSFLHTGGFVFFSEIIIFCFYSFIYLKRMFPVAQYEYDAIFFLMIGLCFAWGGDSSAYFAGRFFGKRKLAPKVSPHKTLEGAVGNVLGSMVYGVAATLIYQHCAGRAQSFQTTNFGVPMVLIVAVLGVFCAILGIFGDLFASVVKRQCDIKDYGTVFPGHGGILDRFDSVMLIAPFVTLVISVMYGA
ncbi:MAG: phosphatidate cytidylyltransferase [Faecalibacterium sp.]